MHAPLRMKLSLVWVPLCLMEWWLKSTACLAQDLLLSRIQGFLLERLFTYVLIKLFSTLMYEQYAFSCKNFII